MARLDPAGVLDALPLLVPGMGMRPADLGANRCSPDAIESNVSSKRLLDDIDRVLNAARAAAAPTLFLPLLQAAAVGACHSPRATGSVDGCRALDGR